MQNQSIFSTLLDIKSLAEKCSLPTRKEHFEVIDKVEKTLSLAKRNNENIKDIICLVNNFRIFTIAGMSIANIFMDMKDEDELNEQMSGKYCDVIRHLEDMIEIH